MTVEICCLPNGKGLEPPSYATSGAAGMDIRAAIAEPITLNPGARALVPTGFKLALPSGWEAQIRPRSGLALKHGITVLNAPGTIDSDYRGEVGVVLVNLGSDPFVVQRGERVAQMVFSEARQLDVRPVLVLSTTVRGEGGFGSTGAF